VCGRQEKLQLSRRSMLLDTSKLFKNFSLVKSFFFIASAKLRKGFYGHGLNLKKGESANIISNSPSHTLIKTNLPEPDFFSRLR
jgi:hypothetical protein